MLLNLFPLGCGGCGGACWGEHATDGRPPLNSKEQALLFAVCSEETRQKIEGATGPECAMLTDDGLCQLELTFHLMPLACRNLLISGPDCLAAREKIGVGT